MTQRALALGRRGRSRRSHHATKQPWHPPIRKLDTKIEKLRETLVPEQRTVLGEIEASIADRSHHLLTGDPGAGKTYLMQVLAALQQNAGRKVVMTAPTHQACNVLRRKMKSFGVDVPVVTTQALLSLKPVPDHDKLVFRRDKHAPPVDAEVVGIDETSMIGVEMHEHINRWLDGRAVIYSGDEGQLFPVGEGRSLTFDTPRHSHLLEPRRQTAGHPVLAVSKAIRQHQVLGTLDWSWCAPVHSGEYGVYVPRDPEPWLRKAFCSDQFNADSESFRMLAWTNDRVASVNRMVREWRYGRVDTPFVAGERALIRAPLVKLEAIMLNTNEEVTVREISRSEKHGLDTWRMVLQTDDGAMIDAEMPQDDRQYQSCLAMLADQARNGLTTWKKFHAFKQQLVTAQAIYCTTTHNAQGTTVRNTFLDMTEMRRWVRMNQDEGLRGLLVASTRPTHGLFCV